jgi:hypothetical protein
MSDPRYEPDGWSGVEAILEIGEWDHAGAPHGLPYPGTTRVPIYSVWEDEARTVLTHVQDVDGCRAPVGDVLQEEVRRRAIDHWLGHKQP